MFGTGGGGLEPGRLAIGGNGTAGTAGIGNGVVGTAECDCVCALDSDVGILFGTFCAFGCFPLSFDCLGFSTFGLCAGAGIAAGVGNALGGAAGLEIVNLMLSLRVGGCTSADAARAAGVGGGSLSFVSFSFLDFFSFFSFFAFFFFTGDIDDSGGILISEA